MEAKVTVEHIYSVIAASVDQLRLTWTRWSALRVTVRVGLVVAAGYLMLGVSTLIPSMAQAQTQQCGGNNQNSCAPPPASQCQIPGWNNELTICRALVISPWGYISGDLPNGGIARVPGWHSSLTEWEQLVKAAYSGCAQTTLVPGALGDQRFTSNILYNQDQYYTLTWFQAQGPNCVAATYNVYAQEYRTVDCLNYGAWNVVKDSGGAYTCACDPSYDCSMPRCPDCEIIKGDPSDVVLGNLRESFTDYQGTGPAPLILRRTYNSMIAAAYYYGTGSPPPIFPLGNGWSATYLQRVQYTDSGSSAHTGAYAFRPDGSIVYFNESNNTFSTAGESQDTLAWTYSGSTKTGWVYTTASFDREYYDSMGRLISITLRGGAIQTLSYDQTGKLTTVADAFGHALTFNWNTDGLTLGSVVGPSGATISYGLDSTANLVKVTYPDSTSPLCQCDVRHLRTL